MRPLAARRIVVFASAAGLALALLAGACGTANQVTIGGDFLSPSGIAIAPARDRDLVFVANTGGNELRVITICNKPSNPDGTSNETTCTADEDFHFLPGPIRVFPGSFPSGQRPTRLAGISLRDTAGEFQGAVLVAGVATEIPTSGGDPLPTLKLVDAANVMDAVTGAAPLREPATAPLDSPPVDVVALELLPGVDPAPGASAPAFVLTQEAIGVPSKILGLAITPSANGPTATATGRCALDFLATRLALIPGQSDKLYVADGSPDAIIGGRGDGAVEILTASLPPVAPGPVPACVINRRISAQDPATHTALPLRSVTVAPGFRTGDGRNHGVGSILGGTTQDGRVVLLSTEHLAPLPLPPFRTPYLDDSGNPGGADTTAPRMEPLRVNGLARDIVFLNNPLACPTGTPVGSPCVIIRVGTSLNESRSVDFSLVAAVSSSDGAVYFLDADSRRFISETRDGKTGEPPPLAFNDTAPVYTGRLTTQDDPTFTFEPAETASDGTVIPGGHPAGWFTPGVARRARWQALWHTSIPGLARRGGTMTRAEGGKLRLAFPGIDLTRWTAAGQLDVGDVIAFAEFSNPSGALCPELADENIVPLSREYRIAAIEDSAIVFEPSKQGTSGPDQTTPGFDPPDTCLPAGAVAEFRVADGFGGRPWLVIQGTEPKGRAKTGERFVAYDTRFDYPLNYDPAEPLPTPDRNTASAFTITGVEPLVPGSFFSWTIDSGHKPTNVRDSTSSFGFAGLMTVYTSKKIPGNLVFVSQSGANAVLQIDPSLIGVLNGILAYR